MNKGWLCTWPADLTSVDLTLDENLVLQFTSPENATVKYYISYFSNYFPIVDASKIKVKGDANAVVELNNAKRTLKVYYDKTTMNDESIELEFAQGALIEGATYTNVVFNFAETLAIDFTITTPSAKVTYTLKLDKSSLMPNPATMGFSDVTSDYTGAEGITILKATTLANIPDRRFKWDTPENGYIDETPFSGQTGYYNDWWSYSHMEDGGPCVWEGLGDINMDTRQKVTLENVQVIVVLIDESEYKGKMYTAQSNSVTTGTVGTYLTISGPSSTQAEACIWDKNVWYDSSLDATWADFQNDDYARTAIGFDADGKFSMKVGYYNRGEKKWYHWNKLYQEGYKKESHIDLGDVTAWNVESVAVSVPSHVRGGHKLTMHEIRTSDYWAGDSAFGDAWNGNRARVFAGKTYDGRVAYAAFQGAYGYIPSLGWEDFNAIGTVQASYVLEKLGFKDLIQIGTAMYTDNDFKPTIILGGKTIIGDPAQAAKYCIGYNPRY